MRLPDIAAEVAIDLLRPLHCQVQRLPPVRPRCQCKTCQHRKFQRMPVRYPHARFRARFDCRQQNGPLVLRCAQTRFLGMHAEE